MLDRSSFVKERRVQNMKEKIEKLIEILNGLTLEEWNQIKNEVDITYRNIEYKKVPNCELGNLKNALIHKFKI